MKTRVTATLVWEFEADLSRLPAMRAVQIKSFERAIRRDPEAFYNAVKSEPLGFVATVKESKP